MKRLTAWATLFALMCLLTPGFAADDKSKKPNTKEREALAGLNDIIGSYKGVGPTWTEKVNWGWKIKGEDRWIVLEIEDGKHFKGGEVRYLLDKKKYQLTMKTVDNKTMVFEGVRKDDTITLDYTDPETKQVTQKLVLSVIDDGVRLIYRLDKKKGTLFVKDFQVAGTREGESFAGGGGKKPVCCVTGGLGTMAVSYKGKTYYVCCSGCREAFNENPEKIIKEFEEAQKKKK